MGTYIDATVPDKVSNFFGRCRLLPRPLPLPASRVFARPTGRGPRFVNYLDLQTSVKIGRVSRLLIAKDLALCAAFALLLWVPLGRRVLIRLRQQSLASGPCICLAVGMALWGSGMLLLGVCGLLYGYLVAAASLLLFAGFRLDRYLFALPEEPVAAAAAGERFLAACMHLLSLVFIVLVLGSALAPELSFDALNVHLPYARDSAASHRLLFAPNNWSSMMPALPLMSYVTAFLFSGVNLAKLFNVLCYLACGGVALFFGCRWWGPVHGAAAALLVWSCPVALYEATTALIDLPLALYSTLCILLLLDWTRRGEHGLLWLSAAFLGLALGCKYQAAFWVLPLSAVVAWHGYKGRGLHLHASLWLAAKYLLLAAAVFSPWMLRAWHYTGNPIFPLANSIFCSPHFTAAMEEAAWAAYANEGVGRSLEELLKLPWTVTFNPGPFRGTAGAVFLIGAAMLLFRARLPRTNYGLICLGCYFYTWALTAQEIRYLLPAVPLLAVLAAKGLLGNIPMPAGSLPRKFLAASGLLLGCIVLFAGSLANFPPVYARWVKDWTYWHSYKSPLGYLLGRETAQEFVARDIPSIYAYDFINRHLTPRDRVLLLNDAFRFYSDVPTLYSFTPEGERILEQTTEEGVLQQLRQARISHVLINYHGVKAMPGVRPRLGVYFFIDEEFQKRYMRLVFTENNVTVYQVRGL